MPDSYEKDGIVFFEKPYRVDALEWDNSHVGLDSIILCREDYDEDKGSGITIYVVCYASSADYNGAVYDLSEVMEYNEPVVFNRGSRPMTGMINFIRFEEA